MRIQTTDYPSNVLFSPWNSATDYFRVQIDGFLGRRFRVVDADIDTSGFYDNVAVRGESGFSGTPTIYLTNGTGKSGGPLTGATSATVILYIGGGSDWGTQLGNWALTLEVETGIETDEYVPLAESGLSYEIQTLGTPNIEEVGGPAPPPACFWTDLVRVSQVCPGDPDPGPEPGGAFQITTTAAPWPHTAASGLEVPWELLIDFSGCPDAMGAIAVRVNVNSFVLTNAYSSTFYRGKYGDGPWIDSSSVQSNQTPAVGDAVNEFTPPAFALELSPSSPLFFIEFGHANTLQPISFSFDISFEVNDGSSWRPMNGTGAEVSLIRRFPSLTVESADPVADGYLEITY